MHELIPWNSRVGSLDRPDYAIIDIDPDSVPMSQIVETANAVRRIIEDGAEGYCKTSGKRGLHIYIPLGRKYTHDQAMMAAKIIATLVNRGADHALAVLRARVHAGDARQLWTRRATPAARRVRRHIVPGRIHPGPLVRRLWLTGTAPGVRLAATLPIFADFA